MTVRRFSILAWGAGALARVALAQPETPPAAAREPFTLPEAVCSVPSDVVCSNATNPYLAAAHARELARAHADAYGSEEAQKLFKADKPKSKKTIGPAQSLALNSKLNARVRAELATPERKAALEILFKTSKAAFVAYLRERQIFSRSVRNAMAAAHLSAMITRIESACLKSPSDSEPVLAAARYDRAGNCVVVDAGLAPWMDSMPEALRFVVLREIARAIDLEAYPLRLGSAQPWSRELRCLAREDAANLKSADAECIEKAGGAVDRRDSELKSLVREAVAGARADAAGFKAPPVVARAIRCQQGQAAEALLDLIATEVFTRSLPVAVKRPVDVRPGDHGAGPNALLQAATLFCPGVSETAETNTAFPTGGDRIDGILLSHPRSKFALGCQPDQVFNTRYETIDGDGERTDLPPGARVHCGAALYQGSKP